jgi:N-formylglutamate amidohydrolase
LSTVAGANVLEIARQHTVRAWTGERRLGRVASLHRRYGAAGDGIPKHPMPHTELKSIVEELTPPFTVVSPLKQTAPFVFCSPHSGRIYPESFLKSSRLDPLTLRKSEDCFVDELFGHVAALGAPLISARFPRAFLDVNREPYELDPELFGKGLPDWANTQSVRVIGGLGTIARIVADGEEIYRDLPLSLEAALNRIELLYKPFHAALGELIDATRRTFGFAILIDCHSMPSATGSAPLSRPDFVLGDRFGAACDPRLTRLVKDAISSLGYDVHLNRPYAGGYITEHYGRPSRQVHAVQLEINRGLYLDEARIRATAGFNPLSRNLELLSRRLFERAPQLVAQRFAAE